MLKDSFLKYLQFEKNYSDKTIVSYGIDLEKFEEYFKSADESLDFTVVDADLIRGWVLSLMEEGYTATSVNRKLSSLRSFYRYLLRQGVVSVDPLQKVVGPKKKKPLPVFVKEADMSRLLDETDFGTSFEGVRDKIILEVFYETGVRLSELVGLTDADVDLSLKQIKVTGKRNKQRFIPFGDKLKSDLNAYLSVREERFPGGGEAFFLRGNGIKVTGKRNKQRFIPFGDKLKSDLNAYLSVREERFPGGGEAFFLRGNGKPIYPKRNKQRFIPFGDKLKSDLNAYLSVREERFPGGGEAFFLRGNGKPIYPGLVYLLVKRNLSKVVSLKKKSPHVLRHSFATSMLNNHAELGAVKDLLGHESLTTTEVYTHTTFEELKKVYEQAHPRA